MAKRTPGRAVRRRPGPRRRVASTTPTLITALVRACRDLVSTKVEFALVGGLAVSARAEPRLTRDVDVAVSVGDDRAAEDVVQRLIARGYRVLTVVEHTRADRLSTVRLTAPDSAVLVDLLFASSGIEREIVAAAETLEILPGLHAPVARTGHLIAMKLLAADARKRPQDLDDIRALLVAIDEADRRLVTTAIGLIERRGFARRRDLAAMWRSVLADTARAKRTR
jgi:hypothetical protein